MDSDSGRTPSDRDRKTDPVARELETVDHGQLPPDPDAGLSEEERAQIVRADNRVDD